MTNRFILGPDDVRRTEAEHAAAFAPKTARIAAAPKAPVAPESRPAPAEAASDVRAPIHKPTKGTK